MAKFSIEEALGFGWKTVKEHWPTLVPITVILFVANAVVSALIAHNRGDAAALGLTSFDAHSLVSSLAGNLLGTVVSVIFAAIITRVCLHYVDGTASDFASLFKGMTPELLVKIIFASILLNILIGIGFILLIIPGIYFALRYCLVTYVLVDKNVGIMEAFDESSRLTQGVKWQLLLFGIVLGCVALAGFIVFIVGIIVALPIVMVAVTHAYRQLTKSQGVAAAQPTAPTQPA